MVLQFNPPDDLVSAYGKRQEEEAQRPTEMLNQGLMTYAKLKLLEQDRKLKLAESARGDAELGIKKTAEARAQDEYLRNYNPAGLPGAGGAYNQYSPNDFGNATSPTLTGDAQMRSMLTQSGGPATLGPSAASGNSPAEFQSPLIARFEEWRANQGAGLSQNTALAQTPSNPQEQANMDFAAENPYGLKGQNTTEDTVLTKDAAGNIIGSSTFKRPIKGKTIVAGPQPAQRTSGLGMPQDRATLKYVEDFNKDSGVIRAKQGIDGAENVRNLATSGNPISAAAIPTYMARASGEVGNLSEPDKAPFGGTRAILGKLEAALTQMSTGQLTEDNKKFLMDLSDTMERSANANLDRRGTEMSQQFSRVKGEKPEDIFRALRPNSTYSSTGALTHTATTGGAGGLTPEEAAELHILEKKHGPGAKR